METARDRIKNMPITIPSHVYCTLDSDLQQFYLYDLNNDEYCKAAQPGHLMDPDAQNTPEIGATLKERRSRYGNFVDHAAITQQLLAVIMTKPGYSRLKPDAKNSVFMIFDKLARAVNGDPDYADNWHDIAGYATLVERRIIADNEVNMMIGEDYQD